MRQTPVAIYVSPAKISAVPVVTNVPDALRLVPGVNVAQRQRRP